MPWSPVLPTAPPLLAVPGWFAVLILSAAGSIPSAEAFGASTVTLSAIFPKNLAPTAIASAQAFGTATLGRSTVNITAEGIPSAEAFGTTFVKAPPQFITTSGIASGEAVGTPTLTAGPAYLFVSGIASGEAFGTHTVVPPVSPFTPFTETNTARTNQLLPTAPAFKGVYFTGIGAGGGGGSGRRGSSANIGGGGGGGGAGFCPRTFYPVASLGSTYSVGRSSTGGQGGAAQSGALTDGNAGTAGAATTFSSGSVSVSAGGGSPGAGGTTTNAAGGAGGTVSGAAGDGGTAGGIGSQVGTTVSAGTDNDASFAGGAGGGGGGGNSTSSVKLAGKAGGATNGQAGGTAGNNTSAPDGGNGSALVAGVAGSGGGGGGEGTSAPGSGGDAPGYGGGGGGGAGGPAVNSGAGGVGGKGYSLLEFTDTDPGSVTFDAAGAGSKVLLGTGASTNWAHTINASAKAVIVTINAGHAVQSATMTAKVGSTNMTQLARFQFSTAGSVWSYIYIFGLLNPPTGAQTITATASASGSGTYFSAQSMSYFNVANFGQLFTNNATGTAMSLSAPCGANQRVAQAFGGGNVNPTTISAYNQTSYYNSGYQLITYDAILVGDALGSPSLNFTATIAGSQAWGGAGVVLSSY